MNENTRVGNKHTSYSCYNLSPCSAPPHMWHKNYDEITYLQIFKICRAGCLCLPEEKHSLNQKHFVVIFTVCQQQIKAEHMKDKDIFKIYSLLIDSWQTAVTVPGDPVWHLIIIGCWLAALKRLFKLDDRCRGRYSLSGKISPETPPGTP